MCDSAVYSNSKYKDLERSGAAVSILQVVERCASQRAS